jgi:hypothetical protein
MHYIGFEAALDHSYRNASAGATLVAVLAGHIVAINATNIAAPEIQTPSYHKGLKCT